MNEERRTACRWTAWWLKTIGYWGATALNLAAVVIGFTTDQRGAIVAFGVVAVLLLGSLCTGVARLIELNLD